MAQLTVRIADELARRVRVAADARRTSMNEYVVRLLDAATNPDLAGDEAARIRERLSAAGLLDEAATERAVRPPDHRVAAARAEAARGTALSDLVSSGRG